MSNSFLVDRTAAPPAIVYGRADGDAYVVARTDGQEERLLTSAGEQTGKLMQGSSRLPSGEMSLAWKYASNTASGAPPSDETFISRGDPDFNVV